MKGSRIKDAVAAEETQVTEEVRENIATYEHDQDEKTVSFSLTTGKNLTLRSPKGSDFLKVESWLQTTDEENRSVNFLFIKLAHTCLISKDKVSFDTFLDWLEDVDDVERMVTAIGFFRDPINKYLAKLERAISASNVSGS